MSATTIIVIALFVILLFGGARQKEKFADQVREALRDQERRGR